MNYRCDSEIVRELLQAREQWLEKAEDVYTDTFITAKNLTKLYPCFTKSWLNRYGCYLYRTQAYVYDEEGNCRDTAWGYSLNFIKKKIKQGYVECYNKNYYFNEDCTEFKRKYVW